MGELSYGFWSAQVNRGDSANGAEVRSIIDKIQVDSVGDGLNVCVYPSEQYKTFRIDIFLTINNIPLIFNPVYIKFQKKE